MTVKTWTNNTTGLFDNPAQWTTGQYPSGVDDAVLGAGNGTAYTVYEDISTGVLSLQTAANATFTILSNQSFQATNGSGTGVNAGTINVQNNAIFYVGGTLNNSGNVNLTAGVNNTDLRFLGNLTLTGGGKITLSDNANNRIFANSGGTGTLINVDNTIQGSGQLGAGEMTLVNEANGVVDATGSTTALVLDSRGYPGANGVTNAGLIEDTGIAGLLIQNGWVDNTSFGTNNSGKLSAVGTAAHLDLQAGGSYGGTFSTSGTGAVIDVVSGQSWTLDGYTLGQQVNNSGNFLVNNNATLTVDGVINNTGSINLNAGVNNTDLRLGTALLTLTGAGSVNLNGTGNALILGSSGGNVTLDNVNNAIVGTGQLGAGSLSVVNEAAGVINANQATGLTIDVRNGFTNQGLIEDTNIGGLAINNTTIDNTGSGNIGKIAATGAGAHVDLQASNIDGGTLTTSGTGAVIDIVSGASVGLDGTAAGAPVNNQGNFVVNNNGSLYLRGAINNTGTISLASTVNNTKFLINTPTVLLEGKGTVNLGVSGNSQIYAADSGAEQLINYNNTISGSGQIGAGQLSLVNQAAGVINANLAAAQGNPGAITIDVRNGFTNSGLVEATLGGRLAINNTYMDNSSGGILQAVGTNSTVVLNATTLNGGTLTASGGGAVSVASGASVTFQSAGSANFNLSTIVTLANNSSLYLSGNFNTAGGGFNIASTTNNTNLLVNSAVVTLSGKGTINLGASGNSQIYAAGSGTQQLYNTDNTITGSGQIGAGRLSVVNAAAGVINANLAASQGNPGTITIDVRNGFTNSGLVEATLGGRLAINNTFLDDSSGGILQAVGKNSNVVLNATTINGGTLTASGGGAVSVASGATATLQSTSAATLNLSTVVALADNSSLNLSGPLNIAGGGFNVVSTGSVTNLAVNSALVTLVGKGTITLSGTGNARISANSAGETLVNQNSTISGSGQLGAGTQLQYVNAAGAIVNANALGALTINTARTVLNAGSLDSATSVANAGGLNIVNTVIDNTSNGAGNTGKLAVGSTGKINLSNSTIRGGFLIAYQSAAINVTGGETSTFDGTGLNAPVTIATKTNISVMDNGQLNLAGTINNIGSITLGSVTSSTNLVLTTGVVTLTGGGQILLSGAGGSNRISESTGESQLNNVNNTISGQGQIGLGSVLNIVNTGTIDATLAGGLSVDTGGRTVLNKAGGVLQAETGSTLNFVSESVTNTGSIVANGGVVKLSAGGLYGLGTAQINGAGTLEIGYANTNTITFGAGSTGTLKIDHGAAFTQAASPGSVAGFGTGQTLDFANVAVGTASLTYAGTATAGVLTITDGTTTATVDLTGNYSQANFHIANDGAGFAAVTYTTPAASAPVNAFNQAAHLLGATASSSSLSTSPTSPTASALLAASAGTSQTHTLVH